MDMQKYMVGDQIIAIPIACRTCHMIRIVNKDSDPNVDFILSPSGERFWTETELIAASGKVITHDNCGKMMEMPKYPLPLV